MCIWILFDWQYRCNNLLWQTEGKSRKLRKTMKQNKHQTERSSDSEKGWNTKCQHESTQTKRNTSNKNGRNCIKSTRIERIKAVKGWWTETSRGSRGESKRRVYKIIFKKRFRWSYRVWKRLLLHFDDSRITFTFRFKSRLNELTCRSQTFTAVFLWARPGRALKSDR